MTKKNTEIPKVRRVFNHAPWAVFDTDIRIPRVDEPLRVSGDWYGEKNDLSERFQILCSHCGDAEGEHSVSVRYGPDGQIHSVWVSEGIEVVRGGEADYWMLDRDGI